MDGYVGGGAGDFAAADRGMTRLMDYVDRAEAPDSADKASQEG